MNTLQINTSPNPSPSTATPATTPAAAVLSDVLAALTTSVGSGEPSFALLMGEQALQQQAPALTLPTAVGLPVAATPLAVIELPVVPVATEVPELTQPALPAALPAAVAKPLPLPLIEEPGPADDTDRATDPQNAYLLAALGLLPQAPMPEPVAGLPTSRSLDLPRLQAQSRNANPEAAATATPLADAPVVQVDDATQALLQRLRAVPTNAPVAEKTELPEAPIDAQPGAADESRADIATPLPPLRPATAIVTPDAAAALAQTPTLVLKGEPTQWQQPLLQALGDRLQLQIAARSEQAVIKLSPPMLGEVQIAIRQQGGELTVQLSASHGEVTSQLQQASEGLRQDLVQRHSGEVSVQVAATGRDVDARGSSAQRDGSGAGTGGQGDAQQQQQQQQRRPGRGLGEGETPAESYAAAGRDAA